KWNESEQAWNSVANLLPKNADAQLTLCYARLYVGRGDPALAENAVRMFGGQELNAPWAFLAGHLAYRLQGDTVTAKWMLAEGATRVDKKSLPYSIIRYLRGEISEQQLNARAVSNRDKTDAKAYVGADQLLKRQREL